MHHLEYQKQKIFQNKKRPFLICYKKNQKFLKNIETSK